MADDNLDPHQRALEAAIAAYGPGGYGHRMRMGRAVAAALEAAGVLRPCAVRQAGDSTWCEACGNRWDTNDDGPACPRAP